MWRAIFRRLALLFIILIIGVGLVVSPLGQEHQHVWAAEQNVMILLIPSLSMEHLDTLLAALPPQLQENLQFGAMTLRTASGMNNQHNMVTLVTGQQGKIAGGWNAYHLEEMIREEMTAEEKYMQLSGKKSTKSIIHPLLFKWQKDWMEEHDTLKSPSLLGDILEREGIYTLALGNSDVQERKKRWAPMFVMDKEGQARGLISKKILQRNPHFPSGYVTDWGRLQQAVHEVWNYPTSTFTVVELGDLERIYFHQGEMEKVHFQRVLTMWFHDLGRWLNTLLMEYKEGNTTLNVSQGDVVSSSILPENLSVWIVSPWVSKEAHSEGRILAPFLTWEQGQEYGIMSSVTTKQAGIVANLDLLPTLLNKFGISKTPDMVGQVINMEGQKEGWRSQIEYMFTIYDKRRSIITAFIVSIIISLIASTLYWWFYRHSHGAKVLQVIIGAILLSPAYFLWLTPIIQYVNEYSWILILFGISLVSSAILYRLFSTPIFIGIICSVITLAICWDVVQGGEWMKRSFLGYDAIIGARFYGIGNEYAGVLLGSSIMAITSFYVGWHQRIGIEKKITNKKRTLFLILTSVCYILILYLVGAPSLGTNFGATLAFLITFPIAQLLLFQYKLRVKHFLIVGLLLIFGFLIFVLLQAQGEHTHINSLIMTLKSGDLQPLFEIMSRKWNMNMRLIKVSLWGKLFVLSLFVLLLFFFKSRKEKAAYPEQRVIWYNGFRSIILGAILLLLFNDSGIVAAATTMLYVTFPLLYQRLDKQMTELQERTPYPTDIE